MVRLITVLSGLLSLAVFAVWLAQPDPKTCHPHPYHSWAAICGSDMVRK